nr:MAG TPA: hypothetical protein [Caudoviricetes sp.]
MTIVSKYYSGMGVEVHTALFFCLKHHINKGGQLWVNS